MKGVSSINVTEDIALVTLNNLPRDLCLTAQILSTFGEQGINIDMISQSAPTGSTADVSFTINAEDVVRALEIIRPFREQHRSLRPMVSSGNCKIQLYGQEMRQQPGVAAQVFSIVSQVSGGEIMLVTTSEVDISLLLAHHCAQEVLAALREYFGVDAE